jgi:hypothetical protein
MATQKTVIILVWAVTLAVVSVMIRLGYEAFARERQLQLHQGSQQLAQVADNYAEMAKLGNQLLHVSAADELMAWSESWDTACAQLPAGATGTSSGTNLLDTSGTPLSELAQLTSQQRSLIEQAYRETRELLKIDEQIDQLEEDIREARNTRVYSTGDAYLDYMLNNLVVQVVQDDIAMMSRELERQIQRRHRTVESRNRALSGADNVRERIADKLAQGEDVLATISGYTFIDYLNQRMAAFDLDREVRSLFTQPGS